MSDEREISVHAPVQERHGLAAITRAAYQGQSLAPIVATLMRALSEDPHDASALMDLSIVEQLKGNTVAGLKLQSIALNHCRSFKTLTDAEENLKLLALAAPVQMGGNTPLEFLLAGSGVALTTLYVSPNEPLPDMLPEHDLAFVAAPGDSDATRQFLDAIEKHLVSWPRPVVNKPCNIVNTERETLYNTLSDVPEIHVPKTTRCDRKALEVISAGRGSISDILCDVSFPIVVRPVGAHAGRGLERLFSDADIATYLATCPDAEFFLSEFMDYRSVDGAFRKYRIVFVNGRPYPCHMAVGDQWKVWYLNADMERSRAKRDEEERFMQEFDHEFRSRHAAAFSAIVDGVGLEYFGIDCAESEDGRLVVFEADNALIVHDMDAVDLYPYKKPQMDRIFSAFVDMLHSGNSASGVVEDVAA